jgi:hypothetical protein
VLELRVQNHLQNLQQPELRMLPPARSGGVHGVEAGDLYAAGMVQEEIKMPKRDLNYIRHVRPQIRAKEHSDKADARSLKYNKAVMNVRMYYTNAESEHNRVCKEAAKMGPKERLMYYAATKDATYLGVGCKWDLLTQWGRDKFGRIIGSIL